MVLKRMAVLTGVLAAAVGLVPAVAASSPAPPPVTQHTSVVSMAEYTATARENGSRVEAADHNCVRVLMARDPRQPNRLASVGAFNICDFTMWPSPWAYFENGPAGIFVNTAVVPEVLPQHGIVYSFGPEGRYAPWGSLMCGQLIVPATGGSSVFGPDCPVI